jgi:hypothetical protein
MTQFVTETQAESDTRGASSMAPGSISNRSVPGATWGESGTDLGHLLRYRSLPRRRQRARRVGRIGAGSKNWSASDGRTAASPEMVNYIDLLKLDVVRHVRVALAELDGALTPVPAAFFGQQKPAKGPASRAAEAPNGLQGAFWKLRTCLCAFMPCSMRQLSSISTCFDEIASRS